MTIQKERSGAGTPDLSNIHHKEPTPVISPTLAGGTHQHNHQVLTHHQLVGVSPKGKVEDPRRVLVSGVDTLEMTIGGFVSPSQYYVDNYKLFEELKLSYQKPDKYFTVQLGNRWFQLYPEGKGSYCFQFRCDEFGFIKVFHPSSFASGVNGKQQIHLKLYSEFIHSVSEEQLIKEIYSICSYFIQDPEQYSIQISRVDLHCDITNGSSFLTEEDVRHCVSRTRFRDKWFDHYGVEFTEDELNIIESYSNDPSYNRGSGKLMNNVPVDLMKKMSEVCLNQLSVGADRLIGGRNLQTIYFGNPKYSNLWGKIYDKTVQVKKEKQEQIQELWNKNGYNGIDTICRVEFSMKRNFLKELDERLYVNLIDFLNNKSKIWEYLTHKFLRMVVEKKENNIQLSEVSTFWIKIQNAFDKPMDTVIRQKQRLGKANQLFLQGLGCLKQSVSIGMIDNEDISHLRSFIQSIQKGLSLSYHNGEIFERRKLLGVA